MRAAASRLNPTPGSPDMVYQPVIPLTGYGGWKFLESTFDKQLEGYTDSAGVKNDRAYFEDKMSSPISMEDFLSDKRLLRIALTAFDLGGEEWKVGFIRHVMEENADPDSTFLKRLNNQSYTSFATTFGLNDGMISLSADTISTNSSRLTKSSCRGCLVRDQQQQAWRQNNVWTRIETRSG